MIKVIDSLTFLRKFFCRLFLPFNQTGVLWASRFRLLLFFLQIFTIYGFIVRLLLTIRSWPQISHTLFHLVSIFGIGFFYDLISALYWSIPLTFYLVFFPTKSFSSILHRRFLNIILFFILYLLGFSAVSEWLFWDEFGVRFNFIAVDYLIYTTEVLGNIRESYPLPLLLGLIFSASGAAYLLLRSSFNVIVACESSGNSSGFRRRLLIGATFLALPSLAFASIDDSLTELLVNQYEKELAADGDYQLFAAFRNNVLDYEVFYPTLPKDRFLGELRGQLVKDDHAFLHPVSAGDITRTVTAKGRESKPNVVLVMMESMSAEFLGVFGVKYGLTPNLDKLARQGMLFTNFYATGTRTVRGMEAVTLSIPPTPGRSIVKRPDNENLFSLGMVFRDRGYDNKFLYGGYGYFDNMNKFFSGNGFSVVDRNSMNTDEITFANVWGVCDEDLFRRAVKEFDQSHQDGKPFFAFLMTTSNHRPYTYPKGKVFIPSHSGRIGGVQYADYAVGAFIREAEQHPWYANTVFVFVADHCASSAGRQELPINRYRIPLIIYAPKLIEPNVINALSGQLDVAPTLLGLLNWNYRSKFFGNDILSPDFTPRAFIGNYEKLGYVRDHVLTVLTEKKQVRQYRINKQAKEDTVLEKIPANIPLRDQAISYYQGASVINKSKLNRYE